MDVGMKRYLSLTIIAVVLITPFLAIQFLKRKQLQLDESVCRTNLFALTDNHSSDAEPGLIEGKVIKELNGIEPNPCKGQIFSIKHFGADNTINIILNEKLIHVIKVRRN